MRIAELTTERFGDVDALRQPATPKHEAQGQHLQYASMAELGSQKSL